jgi:hypothetical protein
MVDVVSIAEKTVRALREKGWTRGDRANESGQLCLIGALSFAACGDAWVFMPCRSHEHERFPDAMRLYLAMKEELVEADTHFTGPMPWNDAEAQSVEGYLAVVAHIALEAGVGPEGNDHWGIAATSLIVLVIVGVVSYGAGMGIIGSYRWRQLERKVRDKRLELSR